ncbi:MAG: undecaprenyl-diphosphate phosphatase [Candidatus Bathyarchaeia archaeon]
MEEAWKAIVLGILQGVLEWLPISSQGNLILVMTWLLGIDLADALSFSVYLHAGTLLAAALYFRRDILAMLKALTSYRLRRSDREGRLISFLLFTTILTGFVGFIIYKLAEAYLTVVGEFFTAVIGAALITTGLIQKFAKEREKRNIDDVKLSDTLILGVVQGFSAFPGMSRSGITISALLIRGFNDEAALKLSFLMSIPAVFIAEIGLASGASFSQIRLMNLLLGVVFSFLMGTLSIHVLMKTVGRIRFWSLCILIGVLAVLPLLSYL